MNNINKSIFPHDINNDFYQAILRSKIIACDIETSGLDWKNDKIGTCQIFIPDNSVAILKIDNFAPANLISILENESIKKIFHHAMFDLRFMCYHWKIKPRHIACTKIVSKLLDISNSKKHSLKELLKEYLNIEIDKEERTSDWFSDNLTEKQVNYATNDVIYLPSLLEVLEKELKNKNLVELENECFNFIPTKVQLDILGYKSIYNY